jgi:soluble lytic murein transglycosylase-like protein
MPAFAGSVGQRSTSIVRADEKSGHLVRSVAVEPHVVAPVLVESVNPNAVAEAQSPHAVPVLNQEAADSDLLAMIDRIAAEQGVEDSLVHSVIRAESNYNARAVSPKGALGMMQLIPSTAKRFGVENAFNPQQNVTGGVKYLKFLLDYYHDDYARVIAAYNAGEAAVDKYNGIPPYAETRNYVYSVAKNLKTAREQRTARKVAVGFTNVETPKRIETSVGSDGRVYLSAGSSNAP